MGMSFSDRVEDTGRDNLRNESAGSKRINFILKNKLRIMSLIRESQLGRSSNNGEIRGNASGE